MTPTELLKWISLGVGRLLVADSVAAFCLAIFNRFHIAELAIGVLLVTLSRSVLPWRSLIAVQVGWSALLGFMRIAYWLLRGWAYGATHPFSAAGYAWRVGLFMILAMAFVYLSRNAPRRRAA